MKDPYQLDEEEVRVVKEADVEYVRSMLDKPLGFVFCKLYGDLPTDSGKT